MNAKEFQKELSVLLNHAARTNDAATLIACLGTGLASVLAISTLQNNLDRDTVIEVIEHDLEVNFVNFLRIYSDAANKTS